MNLLEDFHLSIYLASILAFILSTIFCILVIKVNKNFKTIDNQQKRLSNLNIIPLGGVAMAISFFVSVRLLGEADPKMVTISVFALAISILGVIDDFLNLSWKIKFLFQFLFVAMPIRFLGEYINIENIIGLNFSNYLNFFFTVLWIIVLMNSINFIDNMDGFAALNSSFICIAITILAFIYNQNYLADVSFILLFCILAFFIFNFPPAKIYMGDSGSLFIGFILGFISILFDWNPGGESFLYSSIPPVFLFFTLPLLDFLTVCVHRIKNNIPPTTGGTDHISHRLLKHGYSVQKILLVFSLINFFIFVLLALSITFEYLSLVVFAIYILFIIFLFLRFQKMEPLN
jgi:UDP-GlcNAc:undecaprenyl-phosphate GlcNAc-1-phosphate transferase